jgi:hypothetical protein
MMRFAFSFCFALSGIVTVNASAADAPAFPAVAALEYAAGRVLCSGVVLTDRFVLTAAHCVCAELPVSAFIGRSVFPESNLGLQWRVDLELERPSFFVADFCERFAANPVEGIRGTDLALLQFTAPLSPDIRNAVLRSGQPSDSSRSFTNIFAVGWGESINFWRPGRKNSAELDLIARLCSAEDELRYGCKANIEAVAARPPHDTCFADSGGGLYGVEAGGAFYLIGITARASKETPNNMCGAGGIYTSLEGPRVRAWLLQQIAAKSKGNQ